MRSSGSMEGSSPSTMRALFMMADDKTEYHSKVEVVERPDGNQVLGPPDIAMYQGKSYRYVGTYDGCAHYREII